ncbi:MAG: hypothetical protein JXN64_02440 [Spirochaetes bacterium]|nr:hypothetical protein [Spirochaetota bacterium]
MKSAKYFIITFSLFYLLNVSVVLIADDKLEPSPAPAMPSAYWLESGQSLNTISGQYMRFSSDYFTLKGYGGSYGVDNFWERAALSLNFNGMYMSGESEDSSSDFSLKGATGGLGINLNILTIGSADSFHVNMFGGGSGNVSRINGSTSGGVETNMKISSTTLGLQAGIQLYIPLGENVGLIPFGVLKYDKTKSTTTIETEGSPDQEDTLSTSYISKIIGFDIHIMQLSLGSLFQMRPDDNLIFFHISYSWN